MEALGHIPVAERSGKAQGSYSLKIKSDFLTIIVGERGLHPLLSGHYEAWMPRKSLHGCIHSGTENRGCSPLSPTIMVRKSLLILRE
ncbi:MAG: hypothetical protein KJO91_02930, partial [Gammaproteobacteria bacterium]|nr:hypothetical protein [Gammaproteobacteria bacterium]